MFDEKTLAERDGDAAILALFGAWLEIQDAYKRVPIDDHEDEAIEALGEKKTAVEEQIADAPAMTAAGLAVKAFFVVDMLRGATEPPDESDYQEGELCFAVRMARSLLIDGARVVPDLAPLVAPLTQAPLTRPVKPDPAKLLRQCAEETAAELDQPLPEGEARLIEAGRRLLALDEAQRRLKNAATGVAYLEKEQIIDAALNSVRERLCDVIDDTEPETFAGALVHLRREAELAEDGFVLRKILAIIEREAGDGGSGQRPATPLPEARR